MKKILIIIPILIAIVRSCYSQSIPINLTPGMTGTQTRNTINVNFDSLDARDRAMWQLQAQPLPAGSGIPLIVNGTSWGSTITNNSSNWNTAYGWGNHSAAGYITSQTSHADVVVDGDFSSQGIMLRGASGGNYSILTNNSTNWNTAYGWGNHASGGYASLTNPSFVTGITTPAITLGAVPITANGQELNILDDALFNVNEANKLVGLGPGSLEYRLNNISGSVDPNEILRVGGLQIGSGNNAVRIDSTTNIGQGLTVYQNGTQIGFNNPAEAIINIREIALLKHPELNPQSDSYTPVLEDDGDIITINKGTANTFTLPLNADVEFPLLTQFTVICKGAGQTTIIVPVGVTSTSVGDNLVITVKGIATFLKLDTNDWYIAGTLE